MIRSFLFAAVVEQVEGADAFVICRPLKHFWRAQGANGVVIASAPMLLHAGAREVVILRMTLVVLGAVNQVNDVVDLVIADRPEQLRLCAVLETLRELLEQVCHGPAQPLGIFKAIGAGAGTTRVLDFLFAGRYFRQSVRQLATRTPKIYLE